MTRKGKSKTSVQPSVMCHQIEHIRTVGIKNARTENKFSEVKTEAKRDVSVDGIEMNHKRQTGASQSKTDSTRMVVSDETKDKDNKLTTETNKSDSKVSDSERTKRKKYTFSEVETEAKRAVSIEGKEMNHKRQTEASQSKTDSTRMEVSDETTDKDNKLTSETNKSDSKVSDSERTKRKKNTFSEVEIEAKRDVSEGKEVNHKSQTETNKSDNKVSDSERTKRKKNTFSEVEIEAKRDVSVEGKEMDHKSQTETNKSDSRVSDSERAKRKKSTFSKVEIEAKRDVSEGKEMNHKKQTEASQSKPDSTLTKALDKKTDKDNKLITETNKPDSKVLDSERTKRKKKRIRRKKRVDGNNNISNKQTEDSNNVRLIVGGTEKKKKKRKRTKHKFHYKNKASCDASEVKKEISHNMRNETHQTDNTNQSECTGKMEETGHIMKHETNKFECVKRSTVTVESKMPIKKNEMSHKEKNITNQTNITQKDVEEDAFPDEKTKLKPKVKSKTNTLDIAKQGIVFGEVSEGKKHNIKEMEIQARQSDSTEKCAVMSEFFEDENELKQNVKNKDTNSDSDAKNTEKSEVSKVKKRRGHNKRNERNQTVSTEPNSVNCEGSEETNETNHKVRHISNQSDITKKTKVLPEVPGEKADMNCENRNQTNGSEEEITEYFESEEDIKKINKKLNNEIQQSDNIKKKRKKRKHRKGKKCKNKQLKLESSVDKQGNDSDQTLNLGYNKDSKRENDNCVIKSIRKSENISEADSDQSACEKSDRNEDDMLLKFNNMTHEQQTTQIGQDKTLYNKTNYQDSDRGDVFSRRNINHSKFETISHNNEELLWNDENDTSTPLNKDEEQYKPVNESFKTVKDLPNKLKFVLNHTEWENIKPNTIKHGGQRMLEGPWTDILYEHLSETYKGCVLRFTFNRAKVEGSRKSTTNFWTGKADCTGITCHTKFHFSIKDEPFNNDSVTVDCEIEGTPHHTKSDIKKRQVKGGKRIALAEQLKLTPPIKLYYQNLMKMDTEELESGNITTCQTPQVLQKILSEQHAKEHLNKDIVQELQLLKETFAKEVLSSKQTDVVGYIQSIGVDPFCVILYGQDQVQLLRKFSSTDHLDLYIDATGSVITNIPNQKRPLLYSVIVKPDVKLPPVSCADMITTEHNIPRIEFFLSSLKRNVSLSGKPMRVRKIETDFSWPLIQSCLKTFNCLDVKKYLVKTFQILSGNYQSDVERSLTIHHLCAAHMLRDFIRNLHKVQLKQDKRLRSFVIRSFALLQNSTSLEEGKECFEHMCVVFVKQHNDEDVQTAIKSLTDMFKGLDITVDCNEDDVAKESSERETQELVLEGKTIKQVSPYTKVFTSIYDNVTISSLDLETEEERNTLFCREVISLMLDRFMPLFPLWSGVMLNAMPQATDPEFVELLTRDTNAMAEAWFGIVKKNMELKSHERPGRFVVQYRNAIQARLRETEYPNIRGKKRKKCAELEVDLDEEVWKWKTQKKRSRYMPANRIVRQTSDENRSLAQESGGETVKDNISQDLPKVPKWGGTSKWSTLTNTCTIDNSLTILYLQYLQDMQFRLNLEESSNPVYHTLLTCFRLMEEGQFAVAKTVWLTVSKNEIDEKVDMYGDEYDEFIKYICYDLTSKVESRCSDPNCPEPYTETDNVKGIHLMLSDTDGQRDFHNLVDIFNHWMRRRYRCNSISTEDLQSFSQGVLEIRPHSTCVGEREEIRMITSSPPIVVLRLYEHILSRRVQKNIVLQTGTVGIGHSTYKLAGATLYRQGHYASIIISPQNGILFYDGLVGKLVKFKDSDLFSWTPCHFIFVKCSE